MKIRSDFVTNSSSSSFILARKGDWTEDQKQQMIAFVERNMLGDEILLTPNSTEEEIQKEFEENDYSEEEQDALREALEDGKTIYKGWISFECCENAYASLFQMIWDKLDYYSDGNFEIIDDDLSY